MDILNVIANLTIVAGYVVVPFTWLRYLALSSQVLLSGTLFFLTCALTHLAMTFHAEHDGWMVVNHCVQGASVMWFVFGFWLLLKRADRIRRQAEARYRERVAASPEVSP
jgi:hypothetical protein